MLNPGDIFYSPGGSVRYEVIGAVCRLYDRDELPYPCCRLGWHGKEPFWNRVGRRFVPDIAARRCESYSVKLVGSNEQRIYSFYYKKLTQEEAAIWFTTDKKREKYAAENDVYYGYSQQPNQDNVVREVGDKGRSAEYSIDGYERNNAISVPWRLEDS